MPTLSSAVELRIPLVIAHQLPSARKNLLCRGGRVAGSHRSLGQYTLAISGEEVRMLPLASAVRKKLSAIRPEVTSLPTKMFTR